MADNYAWLSGNNTSPNNNLTIATDDCSGAHVAKVKLCVSADGDGSVIPIDTTFGIPVDVRRSATSGVNPTDTWSFSSTAMTTTAAQTVHAAAGANLRNYVTGFQAVLENTLLVSSEVVIRDGAAGTVLYRGFFPIGGGHFEANFLTPLRGSANTLIEVAALTATGAPGLFTNLQGYIGS